MHGLFHFEPYDRSNQTTYIGPQLSPLSGERNPLDFDLAAQKRDMPKSSRESGQLECRRQASSISTNDILLLVDSTQRIHAHAVNSNAAGSAVLAFILGTARMRKPRGGHVATKDKNNSSTRAALRKSMSFSKRLSAIPTAAGLLARLAYAHAKGDGIDLHPLLRRAGLTGRDINDEAVPIAVTTQISFLNLVSAALRDKLLGFHMARGMDLRSTGLLYYVAASSETLGDALLKIARYASSVNEGISLKIEVGRSLQIGFGYAGISRQSDRHQIEAWITAIMRFCREMTGRQLQPVGVKIAHQRIAESGELDIFLGRPAEFGADTDEMLFRGEVAKLPIVSADPYLNKLLIGCCDEAITRRKATSGPLRENVENTIAALLPHGQAQFEIVAQKLGVSPRTLRRRLAVEAVSFARILEDLRIALAKQYLAERDLSVSRIAWLLGYTEVSAFSHAFRRWTGRAPRAHRSPR